MFGDAQRPDFTGIESPQDPRHLVLFAEDQDGAIVGAVHNNSCHPVSFFGRDFGSADHPGLARRLLRDALGTIPILCLNGGIGDSSSRDLLRPQAQAGGSERVMREQAYIVAGETLRLIGEAERHDDPVLGLAFEHLRIAVRSPDLQEVEADRRVLEKAQKDKDSVERWELLFAFGRTTLVEFYAEHPIDILDILRIHSVRIGELGLVSNPCELSGQFMMDVRARSRTALTMFADGSDVYAGYGPMMYGVIGDGYSGEAIMWTRLSPDAGYRLVDTATKSPYSLWHDGQGCEG